MSALPIVPTHISPLQTPLSLLCNSFSLELRSIPRKRPLFSVPATSNPQSQSCSSLSTAEALIPSSKLERPINCSLELGLSAICLWRMWESGSGSAGGSRSTGSMVGSPFSISETTLVWFLFFMVGALPDEFPDAHSTTNDLRIEYVVDVEGVVRARPSESVNKKIKTGMIEAKRQRFGNIKGSRILRRFGKHLSIFGPVSLSAETTMHQTWVKHRGRRSAWWYDSEVESENAVDELASGGRGNGAAQTILALGAVPPTRGDDGLDWEDGDGGQKV